MDILDSTECHLVKEAESQTIIILHGAFVQKETTAYIGQDILNPAINLTTGFAAFISIEPEPDDSPVPFTLG